jgi:hypothetical protein
MKQKLKIIFGDFLNSLRKFWLEAMGGVFLAFGLLFTYEAIREYRKYVSAPERGITMLAVECFFSGLMLLFALDSFLKARKPR